MYALFNLNKSFIGYSESIPEHIEKTILKREIPPDKVDLTKWRWDGGYDGQMVNLKDNPVVITEKQLQDTLFKTIYYEYPVDVQLINLIKQVYAIAHRSKSLLPEFEEMSKMIINAVDLYEKQRKFYIEQNESHTP
jgi:hypothetical protein